jgi:hypothetical protein
MRTTLVVDEPTAPEFMILKRNMKPWINTEKTLMCATQHPRQT